MASQVSFDVTSSVDIQEVDNAVNQAKKEIAQRYDFKGSKASIDLERAKNLVALVADDDFKMDALWDILQTRLIRRNVPVKNLTLSDPDRLSGGLVKRTVTLQQGPGFDYVQAFTTVKYPGQPLAVAIEPMTAPAEAFNSGRGLRRLAEGESWTLEWGIRFS